MLRTIARLAIISLFLVSILSAQQGRGTIFGTVTDPSGASVYAAKVAITNVDTNNVTETETNAAGYFTSPPLIVGKYQVTAELAGFKKGIRSGLSLQVDQHAEVDFTLQVGGVSESIQVTGETALVNAENASVGQVIENKRVADLPLNGRNAFALVLLSPAVHSNAGPVQSGFTDRGTSLADLSINGGPNAVNNMLVDGPVATNSYYPDLNANLAVDAVQEFKVTSGSMSAEYGFTLGGVVNVATKAGTNQYHGTAYEFVRNNDFDARNAFASSMLPFHYNQYGLAFGGPLQIPHVYNGKNRTFFFGNWEQYHYNQSSQSIISTPIAAQRTGDFSTLFNASGALIPIYDPATTVVNPNGSGYVRNIFAGNLIPANELDPVSKNVNQYYPLPNRTPSNAFTNANNYLSTVSLTTTMQQYTTRVDHRISDKDSIFGRYTYMVTWTDNGTSSPWPDPLTRARYDNFETRNTAVDETHIFSPAVVNEIRLGIARQYFPFQVASFNQNLPTKLGLPSNVPNTALPNFSNGYSGFPTQTVGLRGALTWDATDTVTYVHGNHSIKAGVEYRLLFGNNYQTNNPSGSFNFSQGLTGNPQAQSGTGSTYADFMLGDVANASVGTYIGESEKGHSLSGFVQDDWRVTKRLNVNLGLRYDYQQPPYERNCGTSNFNPYTADPNTGFMGEMQYACKGYGKTFLNSDHADFAPRVGFAYDLTGSGKTIVRGGYAIFYPSIFTLQYFGSTQGFASTNTSYNPAGNNGNLVAFQLKNGFPSAPIQPLGASLGSSFLLGQGVSYNQPNDKTPMSQQWDFSVQKQLPGNWVVDASYAGNHGTHLVAGSYGMNQLNPKYLSNGTALQSPVANPYAGKISGSLGSSTITLQQSLLPFPYYTSVTVSNPHLGDSIYHAAMLTVQRRFTQGLTFLASYTKAKLIDDSAASPIAFGAVQNVSTVGYQNGLFDRRLERAIDPTNVPQRLAISLVYELPIGHGRLIDIQNRILDGIVGGWQTQGVMTLQKGQPVQISGANNNLASRPNSTGKSAKLSDPTRYEWFDTSVFVNPPSYTYGNVSRTLPDVSNPGFFNLDCSLIKNVKFRELMTLQIRAEAFNVDNHMNLGGVNGSFSPGTNGLNQSSTFGTITSATAARSLQFGAKLIF
jgi:hypothetical protein